NSVEGLKPNHVTVVDNLGNVLSENSDNDSLTGLTSTQLAARRNLDQYLGKKAQDMLEKVLGPGQAIVRVSADINYDTVTRSEEKFDPDGQVFAARPRPTKTPTLRRQILRGQSASRQITQPRPMSRLRRRHRLTRLRTKKPSRRFS